MTEFFLDSAGKGKIRCGMWRPEGTPRAIVQLVHGIAEHIVRYDVFAEYLVSNGILVVANDHMGHGGSICEECGEGVACGGWTAVVADVYALMQKTMAENPGVPYFLMGHSMGSFLARTFLYTYPDSGIAGVILSGTAWQPSAVLCAGLAVCSIEIKRYTPTGRSPLIQNLIFGAYNKTVENPKTPNDWISSDEQVVAAYTADPLCGFMPTVGLAREMLRGLRMNQKTENLNKMKKDLPVYFFSGALDPVGANGKGVRQSEDAFRKAGMKDVQCKLYENGRHEMLNEVNRTEVYADVLNWLDSKVKSPV